MRKACGEGYISVDLAEGKADVAADIVNLPFSEEQFEYIICNHVMEHVQEEGKAFSELRRCMKPGGVLLFTVPICWEQETYENEKIVTAEEKILYYGQDDHVCLYGNNIVKRVTKFGFEVEIYFCRDEVEKETIERMGFIAEDSVLLCRK